MNIIILGAGQVGSSVAENLADGQNDVTVVDINLGLLQTLQDRLDIRTVYGHGSYPEVLEQAGADQADMLLAVTDSDETNMVACQVAYTIFKIPQKIARVREISYLSRPELFTNADTPVDLLISPEQMVTDYIVRLIELPGTQQVMDFADGKVRIVSVKAHTGGLLIGHEIQEIREHIPEIDTRIVALFRHGRPMMPRPDSKIKENDIIYFVAEKGHSMAVIRELRRSEKPYKSIMIAGGGNIGLLLAKALEDEYKVKIIEQNKDRALQLAEELDNSIVLRGDAADRELLVEENIENTDVFVAVTSADEANILSSMLAKRLGVNKVMTLINRPDYVNLIESDVIDVAISPKQVTISALLARVRRGDVVSAHLLRNSISEVLEVVVHGDAKTSSVIGKRIGEIKLPKVVSVVAVLRDDEVFIAHKDFVIEAEDHVVLFVLDKNRSTEVERLFAIDSHSLHAT